jgi:hypothetical protein
MFGPSQTTNRFEFDLSLFSFSFQFPLLSWFSLPCLASRVFCHYSGVWQCPECKRASMPPSANAPVLVRQLSANGAAPATFVPPPDEDITRSVLALDYAQSDVDEIDGFKV